jgi:hypothetical protein
MSRTDNIIELLTSLRILVLIILLASISSCYPHLPFHLLFIVRQLVVLSISSISHFILLLGLAFCHRRVWCQPYHLLFYALFICHLLIPFISSDVSPSVDIIPDLASFHLPHLVRF